MFACYYCLSGDWLKCIIALCVAFAVANQETCEQPHFVDWALWEHGCLAERNVCIDQVSTTPKHSSRSTYMNNQYAGLVLYTRVQACAQCMCFCKDLELCRSRLHSGFVGSIASIEQYRFALFLPSACRLGLLLHGLGLHQVSRVCSTTSILHLSH